MKPRLILLCTLMKTWLRQRYSLRILIHLFFTSGLKFEENF